MIRNVLNVLIYSCKQIGTSLLVMLYAFGYVIYWVTMICLAIKCISLIILAIQVFVMCGYDFDKWVEKILSIINNEKVEVPISEETKTVEELPQTEYNTAPKAIEDKQPMSSTRSKIIIGLGITIALFCLFYFGGDSLGLSDKIYSAEGFAGEGVQVITSVGVQQIQEILPPIVGVALLANEFLGQAGPSGVNIVTTPALIIEARVNGLELANIEFAYDLEHIFIRNLQLEVDFSLPLNEYTKMEQLLYDQQMRSRGLLVEIITEIHDDEELAVIKEGVKRCFFDVGSSLITEASRTQTIVRGTEEYVNVLLEQLIRSEREFLESRLKLAFIEHMLLRYSPF